MDRQSDGHTAIQCETIIPCHFHVAENKNKYLHRFSGDNIIKILEEKIFADVMSWTVIFAYSEDGEISWHDVSNL